MRSHPARHAYTATGQPMTVCADRSVSGVFPSLGVRPTCDVDVGDGLPAPRASDLSDVIAAAIASALCDLSVPQPTTEVVVPAPAPVRADEGGGASAPSGLPSRAGGVIIGAMLVFAIASLAAVVVFSPKPDVILNHFAHAVREANASGRSVAVATASPLDVPPPVPAPEVASPPPAPSAPPSVDATKGTITLPSSARGHRIYVDGRLTAEPSSFVLVRSCGSHVVKIGSRGRDQAIVVPCGGDVALAHP